jgi:hypothetical protein
MVYVNFVKGGIFFLVFVLFFSSINETDCHNITEILLKVALNTINLNLLQSNRGVVAVIIW